MQTPAAKLTLVFVHGSWHNPNFFAGVRCTLEERGYSTRCPDMPTDGPERLAKSLADDAACVSAEVAICTDQGADVILILHSYGGLPGSQVLESFCAAMWPCTL